MAVPGYVLKHKRTTLERAEKFVSDTYFTDINLRGKLYPKRCPVKKLSHYAAPGRISYSEAMAGEYKDASVGQVFGPTWATHWFQIDIEIPVDWVGECVLLKWNSNSEAMIWQDGKPLQGFNSNNCDYDYDRTEYVLSKTAEAGSLSKRIYIEMACNDLFGAGNNSMIGPTDNNRTYKLSQAEIVVMNPIVKELLLDFEIMIDLVKHLPKDSNRGYQALYAVNDMVNVCDVNDNESLLKAREIAKKFFAQGNGESQHTMYAVGNCHIDSAWLWPYAETIRKCGRSFSSTIRLMEEYPEFTFACSQAQQFEWVKETYPPLYEEMKKYINEGRFIPVGGTWVEMDGLVPSGEAFIRQFLYGQQYFMKEFGVRCTEFWLPDTFGYSAQLPQIMKLSGIERFVTQKISWNLVNKFPNHVFWWYGLNGTRVLSHFPPGDSYEMKVNVKELMYSINNFQDKGRVNRSLYLYGFGDGGQGPTSNMLKKLQRVQDIDGCPKVKLSTPSDFFEHIEKNETSNLCQWKGELYLEMHNGTYTTQAKTKLYNRKCEFLLQQVEMVSTLAFVFSKKNFQYPSTELLRLWKLVLLNQFHDVLPGSSINLVYKDAMEYYEDVCDSGKKLLTNALSSLIKVQCRKEGLKSGLVFNPLYWRRKQVIEIPNNFDTKKAITQASKLDNKAFVLVESKGFGCSSLSKSYSTMSAVETSKCTDGAILLRNEHLEVKIDRVGRITGLFCNGSARNGIAPGQCGNQFVIFDDVPLYWDAWDVMDYHLETRKPITCILEEAKLVEVGPLRAVVQVSLKISDNSFIKQLIILDSGCAYLKFNTEVEWHENRKFLKIEFPTSVLSNEATYEIQFGHLKRPTHFNTSWDWAKYEVCGHKWADLSEYNYGVAVLNDSKYGWSCIDNVLRLSLLKSSKAPDEVADMGLQRFSYAVMPHSGSFQSAGVIRAAYELNCPLDTFDCDGEIHQLQNIPMEISEPSVICEALKKAEDREDAVVMRFYESFGSSVSVQINPGFNFKKAFLCNALEDVDNSEAICIESGKFQLLLAPFEIKSVLCII